MEFTHWNFFKFWVFKSEVLSQTCIWADDLFDPVGFFTFQMNTFFTIVNDFSSIWKGFWSVHELYDT